MRIKICHVLLIFFTEAEEPNMFWFSVFHAFLKVWHCFQLVFCTEQSVPHVLHTNSNGICYNAIMKHLTVRRSSALDLVDCSRKQESENFQPTDKGRVSLSCVVCLSLPPDVWWSHASVSTEQLQQPLPVDWWDVSVCLNCGDDSKLSLRLIMF